jgi:hypothetical protein
MKRRICLGACIWLVSMAGSGCVLDAHGDDAEASFSRNLTATGPVELDVRTGAGSIHVQNGGAGTVAVQGRVRASWVCWSGASSAERVKAIAANPPIEQSGNEIRLDAWQMALDCVTISFDVTVPPDTRVTARSGSGRQNIAGIKGRVDATTGSGSMRIERVSSDVRAWTGSGRIEVRDAAGSLTARTGSGSIQIDGLDGNLDAHAGSGSVTAERLGRGRADVSTGSGRIWLSGARGALRLQARSGSISVDGEPADAWDLDTTSGSVDVRVPGNTAFDFSARTRSGHIHTDRALTVSGSFSGRELYGKVGGGGPQVAVSTASGSIRIQ